jgi:hypothetical protein
LLQMSRADWSSTGRDDRRKISFFETQKCECYKGKGTSRESDPLTQPTLVSNGCLRSRMDVGIWLGSAMHVLEVRLLEETFFQSRGGVELVQLEAPL